MYVKNTKVFLILGICLAVIGLGVIGFALWNFSSSDDIDISSSEPEMENVVEDEDATSEPESTSETEATEEQEQVDLSNTSDIGPGSMTLVTSNGTSDGGQIPVLYAKPDSIHQIGLDTKNYDGRHLTYIYIDNASNMSKRYSQTSNNTLTLEGDALTAGVHTIELFQYENDDPTAGIFSYHKAQYEVKPEQ